MGLGRCPRGSGTAIPLPRRFTPAVFFVSLAILGIFFGGQSLDKQGIYLLIENTVFFKYGVEIRP